MLHSCPQLNRSSINQALVTTVGDPRSHPLLKPYEIRSTSLPVSVTQYTSLRSPTLDYNPPTLYLRTWSGNLRLEPSSNMTSLRRMTNVRRTTNLRATTHLSHSLQAVALLSNLLPVLIVGMQFEPVPETGHAVLHGRFDSPTCIPTYFPTDVLQVRLGVVI